VNSNASLLFKSPPIPYIIACGRGRYQPGESHNNRNHIGVFDLLIVHRGTLYIGENGQNFAVKEGHAFILRPDLHHYAAASCEETTLYYWIHFQTVGEWEERDGDYQNIRLYTSQQYDRSHLQKDEFTLSNYIIHVPKLCVLPYPANTYNKIEQLLTLEQMSPPSARWQQQTIFEELLKEIHLEQSLLQEQNVVQLAESIATYLRQNYAEPFKNATLQNKFSYHPNHLTRCMKKVFGCTPLEYLLVYRIDRAKQMLLTTAWPVSRIAEETGFNQLPYFTRLFRKYEGVSPIQYRMKFMKKKSVGIDPK
jgi:YesN/AraC family two-component response regulator